MKCRILSILVEDDRRTGLTNMPHAYTAFTLTHIFEVAIEIRNFQRKAKQKADFRWQTPDTSLPGSLAWATTRDRDRARDRARVIAIKLAMNQTSTKQGS